VPGEEPSGSTCIQEIANAMPSLIRRVFIGAAALALASPVGAVTKTPPKHTSTLGTPVVAPPTTLKPGEYVWHPEASPRGPMVMVVSLDEQVAYVYRNGVLIGATTGLDMTVVTADEPAPARP
jgi:hypothetical protein